MEESSKRDFLKALESYVKEYENYLREVREETYRKFPEETGILIGFIDNWIDIIPVKEKWEEYIHSLLGVLLFHLWKMSNWIGYEILNGKYFEAFRDCRFMFEASILSVIMEDAIESNIYKKWESLSSFDLKCEIFHLWEELRDKGIYRKKKKEDRENEIKKHVKEFMSRSNLSKEEKEEYSEVYCSILCNEKLGYSIPKMIEECGRILPIGDKERLLKDVWKTLNKYTHFTNTFCDTALHYPDFIFIETMNEELFKECFKAYFNTMDLFYCVLCWRFPKIKEKMEERVIDWWNKNFSLHLELTERIIEYKNTAYNELNKNRYEL